MSLNNFRDAAERYFNNVGSAPASTMMGVVELSAYAAWCDHLTSRHRSVSHGELDIHGDNDMPARALFVAQHHQPKFLSIAWMVPWVSTEQGFLSIMHSRHRLPHRGDKRLDMNNFAIKLKATADCSQHRSCRIYCFSSEQRHALLEYVRTLAGAEKLGRLRGAPTAKHP